MQLGVLTLSFLLGIASAHVRLTFPPARTFAFDFLDNARTSGPCGMESDLSTLTNLQNGSAINVTWHLAYSHRGGFRLELMNNTAVVANLTAGEGFVNEDDITTTSYEVTIPADLEGVYTLRLIRHAMEWTLGNDGGDYIFWSCADVNIIAANDCSGGCESGTCDNGECTSCPHLSSGKYCQYQDDCLSSEDCSSNGECWKVSATTYPQNQCFCEEGYFGRKCERENPSDFSLTIDTSKYFERSFNDGYKIYYMIREAQGEIEIAVEADSSSWVALGWKPTGLTSDCQNFPVQYRSGEPNSEPESEPETTATDAPPASSRRRRSHPLQDGVQTQNVNIYNSDWTCSPDMWTGPEGEAEPESEPEPSSEPEAEPEGTNEPGAEPEGTGEPEAEPEGTGEPEAEPEGGSSNLHPMNCMDVVIGRAIGHLGNVGDYYTRDRSTPRLDDEFYNGADDLQAAGAKEEGGKTTVVFRRKLETGDQADHDIAFHEAMQVIWAKGQEFGEESHNPASGLENCEAKDYLFYRRDEIKYHGSHNSQRGFVPELDFYVDPDIPLSGNCVGSVAKPDGCTGDDCQYRAQWNYKEEEDEVEFTVIAKTDQDKWTGIGFSPDGSMIGSDAVIAWHDGSDGIVKDYYLGGKSQSTVVEDESSDIKDASVAYVDGSLRVSFTRKRDTGDSTQDIILDDEDCFYILQPVEGGTHAGGIARHTGTPLTTAKVCVGVCEGNCPDQTVGCGANELLSSISLVAMVMFVMKLLHG
ncbi:uncharacterized protein [Apostichopus japonicus]|uniref:uncharacterized protein isoform X3 n=1 Tax=Stichopus japonicus TaxID=307972 RepID=UPI003AB4B8EE